MIEKLVEKIISHFEKKVDTSNYPIPCTTCGACCAYFKVTYPKLNNEFVPKHRVIEINKTTNALKGADKFKGKCEALTGEIGKVGICDMYESRPHVCRDFPVWMPNGKQNPRCVKARVYHGIEGKIDISHITKQ